MLFHAMMEFCLDLLRSKFWLIGEWSIASRKSIAGADIISSCEAGIINSARRLQVVAKIKLNGMSLAPNMAGQSHIDYFIIDICCVGVVYSGE